MTYPIERRPTLAAAAALLEAADLPAADLTDAHMEHFFYSGAPSQPTGLVGLELCGQDALLRSLAVAPDHRGTGLGAALAEQAERHARSAGVRSIFLLTTTAEQFFARRGYARATREGVPAGIRTTREFADICPASSALMVKHLR
jgi:amino-acid N-acetyltransferase